MDVKTCSQSCIIALCGSGAGHERWRSVYTGTIGSICCSALPSGDTAHGWGDVFSALAKMNELQQLGEARQLARCNFHKGQRGVFCKSLSSFLEPSSRLVCDRGRDPSIAEICQLESFFCGFATPWSTLPWALPGRAKNMSVPLLTSTSKKPRLWLTHCTEMELCNLLLIYIWQAANLHPRERGRHTEVNFSTAVVSFGRQESYCFFFFFNLKDSSKEEELRHCSLQDNHLFLKQGSACRMLWRSKVHSCCAHLNLQKQSAPFGGIKVELYFYDLWKY